MKKKKRQSRFAGIIFSCAFVAVSITLFLFSDSGAAFLASAGIGQTVYEPTPAPTQTPAASATPKQKKFAADDFLKSAESLGAAYEIKLVSENARAVEYDVTDGGVRGAALTLSLQNESVTGFVLSMDCPHAPAPLAPDATLLYQMEHERQLAEYEEALEWYCHALTAYALALDYEQSFSYAELTSISDAVFSAVQDGKGNTFNIGDFHGEIAVTAKDMIEVSLYAK